VDTGWCEENASNQNHKVPFPGRSDAETLWTIQKSPSKYERPLPAFPGRFSTNYQQDIHKISTGLPAVVPLEQDFLSQDHEAFEPRYLGAREG
jgi:hypothetical protein